MGDRSIDNITRGTASYTIYDRSDDRRSASKPSRKKSPMATKLHTFSVHSIQTILYIIYKLYTRQGCINLGVLQHSQAPTCLRPCDGLDSRT